MEEIKSCTNTLKQRAWVLQSATSVQQSSTFQSCLSEGRGSKSWLALASPTTRTREDCGPVMLPLCSTNAVSAQTDRPSKMLLHSRERWTCRNTLPPSAASSPNADDITTTRMVTIYTNLKPWVNTEVRAGSKADTPDGTCSLPEPLRFGFCGQLKEVCQLKKIVSDSVSIRVNVTFQGFSFSLIIQDTQRQWPPPQLLCLHILIQVY